MLLQVARTLETYAQSLGKFPLFLLDSSARWLLQQLFQIALRDRQVLNVAVRQLSTQLAVVHRLMVLVRDLVYQNLAFRRCAA